MLRAIYSSRSAFACVCSFPDSFSFSNALDVSKWCSGCLVLSDGFDVMTGEKRDFESLFSSAFRLFAGCLEEGDKKN